MQPASGEELQVQSEETDADDSHKDCFELAYLAYNWSIHKNYRTRRLQMFQCKSTITPFLDCSKMVWVAVVVDDAIKLAQVLIYYQN